MGLVSTQFTVIASASAAGVISTNNRRWALINNVQQTLAGAERTSGVAAFADVVILDDEDYGQELAKQNAVVAIVWLKDQEHDATSSSNRVTIVNLQVDIYARKNTDDLGDKADVLSELAVLADIAANALYTDKTRGGNAEDVLYGTSSSMDATEISEYEITDQQSPQWARAKLTVRCGYYHSQTGR